MGNHGNHSESSFNSEASISQSALHWILAAGGFAAALTTFIIYADYSLSHSTREKDLGATLLELRTAQASLPARVTDPRQTESFLSSTQQVPVAVIK